MPRVGTIPYKIVPSDVNKENTSNKKQASFHQQTKRHRMQLSLDQSSYWDSVAETKTFSHAIDWNVLRNLVIQRKKDVKNLKIPDFGCRYGRLTADFHKEGFLNAVGIDSSLQMVQRTTREFPNTAFIHVKDSKLPFDTNHFELICLFDVMTTIPRTTDQKALVAELERVSKPDSGMPYIRDCLFNHDKSNVVRYNEHAQTDENDDDTPYGVFEITGEEALLRHHDLNYMRNELLAGWNIKHMNTFTVTTMNGNPSNAFQ